MDKNKKIIAKISAAFVGILLLLTFFSNTIFNFNLTNVSVAFTREGVLVRNAVGRGIAEFAEVDEYFSEIAGRVEVFVSEGDFVYVGDELYTIFADVEEITVVAERDGVVRNIGITPNRYVDRNERILNVGAIESGFKAIVYLMESVDFLQVGDTVTLNIHVRNLLAMPGSIYSLMLVEGRLRVEVRFESDRVSGGETVELQAEHISTLFDTLVPNNALRTDTSGNFVLVAEMVEGTLRNEYFARRINASIIAQDSRNTAVILHTEQQLPIIINSDRIVLEGDRIRIVSGSDLVGIR
jgi:hypothetical protein